MIKVLPFGKVLLDVLGTYQLVIVALSFIESIDNCSYSQVKNQPSCDHLEGHEIGDS